MKFLNLVLTPSSFPSKGADVSFSCADLSETESLEERTDSRSGWNGFVFCFLFRRTLGAVESEAVASSEDGIVSSAAVVFDCFGREGTELGIGVSSGLFS